jgi:hypothetical protein
MRIELSETVGMADGSERVAVFENVVGNMLSRAAANSNAVAVLSSPVGRTTSMFDHNADLAIAR